MLLLMPEQAWLRHADASRLTPVAQPLRHALPAPEGPDTSAHDCLNATDFRHETDGFAAPAMNRAAITKRPPDA